MKPQKIQVALADDHSIIREGLKRILLNDPDIEIVAEASNSREALQAGRSRSTHVLILDVSMPGRGGFDTLHQLHRLRPELPILIFSYYPEAELAVRALRGGASGYLSKDRAPEELLLAVRKVAGGGRYITPATAERLARLLDAPDALHLHEQLSAIELRIFCLVASGWTTGQISHELCLSGKTVSAHQTRILETMEMKNHAQIIHYALDHGLALECRSHAHPSLEQAV